MASRCVLPTPGSVAYGRMDSGRQPVRTRAGDRRASRSRGSANSAAAVRRVTLRMLADGVQDQFEELAVREPVRGGFLQPQGERLGQRRQPQLFEGGIEVHAWEERRGCRQRPDQRVGLDDLHDVVVGRQQPAHLPQSPGTVAVRDACSSSTAECCLVSETSLQRAQAVHEEAFGPRGGMGTDQAAALQPLGAAFHALGRGYGLGGGEAARMTRAWRAIVSCR
jgi:hypothetical protein